MNKKWYVDFSINGSIVVDAEDSDSAMCSVSSAEALEVIKSKLAEENICFTTHATNVDDCGW